jgi:hypothetical protein
MKTPLDAQTLNLNHEIDKIEKIPVLQFCLLLIIFQNKNKNIKIKIKCIYF